MAHKYVIQIQYEDASVATIILYSDGHYEMSNLEVINQDSLNSLLKAIEACKTWLAANAGEIIKVTESEE